MLFAVSDVLRVALKMCINKKYVPWNEASVPLHCPTIPHLTLASLFRYAIPTVRMLVQYLSVFVVE